MVILRTKEEIQQWFPQKPRNHAWICAVRFEPEHIHSDTRGLVEYIYTKNDDMWEERTQPYQGM
jgi:hypothetical protein